MRKIRETAAQRRAREAAEARAALEAWEREKPARLLQALALAYDLNVDARVQHNREGELYYDFHFGDGYEDHYGDPVDALSEWIMQMIEQRLQDLQAERNRQERLREVRAQLIATLTDEQKEALGL